MLFRKIRRTIRYSYRLLFYWFQRVTGWGIDYPLEKKLSVKTKGFLTEGNLGKNPEVPVQHLESMNFSDSRRFRLFRDDIYKRFVALEGGTESDNFGRKGQWVSRGCKMYYDLAEDMYIKVFDTFFCAQGEGKYLPTALERGVYDFLCPALAYIIRDGEDDLRGYAIHAGRTLTPYEFERYVGVGLKEAICEVTRLSGLYFYDLTFHNVIRRDDEISLIDLESVLPIGWYGEDKNFSMQMLEQIDIGYSIQKKFLSPKWYADHIEKLRTH